MKRACIFIFFALVISVNGQSPVDTMRTGQEGIQRLADSLATGIGPDNGQKTTKKIKIIKKDINYSGFVKLALGMMVFIALFFTTAQNYNPS
jgi:hypothetical protein